MAHSPQTGNDGISGDKYQKDMLFASGEHIRLTEMVMAHSPLTSISMKSRTSSKRIFCWPQVRW